MTWRRDEEVVWRRSFDRVIVARPGQESVAVLEGAAALVWLCLDEPGDGEDVAGRVLEAFGEPGVDRLVSEAFRTLLDAGVVVTEHEPT